jgi:hypothetical protein
MLLTMNGDVWWRGGALSAQCGLNWSSGSRHSMSSTCGPRDIISLVTPRLGGMDPKKTLKLSGTTYWESMACCMDTGTVLSVRLYRFVLYSSYNCTELFYTLHETVCCRKCLFPGYLLSLPLCRSTYSSVQVYLNSLS